MCEVCAVNTISHCPWTFGGCRFYRVGHKLGFNLPRCPTNEIGLVYKHIAWWYIPKCRIWLALLVYVRAGKKMPHYSHISIIHVTLAENVMAAQMRDGRKCEWFTFVDPRKCGSQFVVVVVDFFATTFHRRSSTDQSTDGILAPVLFVRNTYIACLVGCKMFACVESKRKSLNL